MEIRIIKFRFWDSAHVQYVFAELRDGELIWSENYFANSVLETPEQFTGLLDKNDKEIYEGDVVEWDDGSNGKWRRRCQVIYTPAHYRLVGYYYDVSKPEVKKPIEFECGAFAYEKETDKELEVIGNIHENPDLLGSGETNSKQ